MYFRIHIEKTEDMKHPKLIRIRIRKPSRALASHYLVINVYNSVAKAKLSAGCDPQRAVTQQRAKSHESQPSSCMWVDVQYSKVGDIGLASYTDIQEIVCGAKRGFLSRRHSWCGFGSTFHARLCIDIRYAMLTCMRTGSVTRDRLPNLPTNWSRFIAGMRHTS